MLHSSFEVKCSNLKKYLKIRITTLKLVKYYTVKPVYNSQPQGMTKVAFVDRWPLFRALETTYLIFSGQIETGLCGHETITRRCPYAQI